MTDHGQSGSPACVAPDAVQSSPASPNREAMRMLSAELVRSVLDSAPDAMIIIDSAGNMIFANRQVSALFGHAPDSLIGSPIEILLPERFRGRHVGHRRGYTDNVRVRPMGAGLDLFGIRRDGSEFPVEISLSPIAQGDEVMVAAAIRDVTERKVADRALEAAKREAEDARQEAEHANLAKSRFLATASHDLRQPLQTLGLLNGAMRRMTDDEECREVLEQQDQAVDAMSRLLNALLDISKLESGAIKPEIIDFEVDALFDDLRRDFTNLAANKRLRLTIDSPHELAHSDPALIGQALRNLLANAIKYTHAGWVELRCDRRDDMLRIEVRDSGIGIADDQTQFIFDEFYQTGVSPNSSRDGYGLGLSIVRRIARLLNFNIQVTSKLGTGSVFTFEIPAAQLDAATTVATGRQRAIRPDGGNDGCKVLLVEDDPGVRNAMRLLLKMEGYQVTAAAGAVEALKHLDATHDFDLIVTDFHLENGRTGTEVISAARSRLGARIKAVLVSGDTSSAVSEMKVDSNTRITSKPINPDELLGVMRSLLAS
jgi:two-component system, sensor histidine kinase